APQPRGAGGRRGGETCRRGGGGGGWGGFFFFSPPRGISPPHPNPGPRARPPPLLQKTSLSSMWGLLLGSCGRAFFLRKNASHAGGKATRRCAPQSFRRRDRRRPLPCGGRARAWGARPESVRL